ncbi:MAG: hypothetical protein KJN63_03865 [Acidimicrobiia bacterium]|nr:hypothetical protein [Acidimicrobiia bacterium]
MQTAKCDKKGRLYLRGSLRAKHGEEFIVIEFADRLLLLEVHHNPVIDLEQIGEELADDTVEDLKSAIEQQAEEELAA